MGRQSGDWDTFKARGAHYGTEAERGEKQTLQSNQGP